jgi:hypothetical protein
MKEIRLSRKSANTQPITADNSQLEQSKGMLSEEIIALTSQKTPIRQHRSLAKCKLSGGGTAYGALGLGRTHNDVLIPACIPG